MEQMKNKMRGFLAKRPKKGVEHYEKSMELSYFTIVPRPFICSTRPVFAGFSVKFVPFVPHLFQGCSKLSYYILYIYI